MVNSIEAILLCRENLACDKLYQITNSYVNGEERDIDGVDTLDSVERLLQFFVTQNNSRKTRRWAGVLLEALISQSLLLRDHVVSLKSQLPFVGSMVLRENEDLKLVAATIISALVQKQNALSLFWPRNTLKPQQIRKFPLTDMQSNSWMEDLTHFMNDVQSQLITADPDSLSPGLFFVQDMDLGQEGAIRFPDRSIYLMIQDAITITAAPPNRSKILYFDIPLHAIASCGLHEGGKLAVNSQKHETLFQMVVSMKAKPGGNCLVNATDKTYSQLFFTFDSQEKASEAVESLNAHLETVPKPVSSARSRLFNVGDEVEEDHVVDHFLDAKGPPNAVQTQSENITSPPRILRTKLQTVSGLASLNTAISPAPEEPTKSVAKKKISPEENAPEAKKRISKRKFDAAKERKVVTYKGKKTLASNSTLKVPKMQTKALSKAATGKLELATSPVTISVLALLSPKTSRASNKKDVYDVPVSDEDNGDDKEMPLKKRARPAAKTPAKAPAKAAIAKTKKPSPKKKVRKIVEEDGSEDEYQDEQTKPQSAPRKTRAQAKGQATSSTSKATLFEIRANMSENERVISPDIVSSRPITKQETTVDEVDLVQGIDQVAENNAQPIAPITAQSTKVPLLVPDKDKSFPVERKEKKGKAPTDLRRIVPDSEADDSTRLLGSVLNEVHRDTGMEYEPQDLERSKSSKGVAKQMEVVESKVVKKVVKQPDKVGSSQAHPIEIPSDHSSSNSSQNEDGDSGTVGPEKDDGDLIHPQTEQLAKSEPESVLLPTILAPPNTAPQLLQTAIGQPVTPRGLLDEASARKISVVSFDRTGPRNQGFLPGARQVAFTPNISSEPPVPRTTASTVQIPKPENRPFHTQPTQPWSRKLQAFNESIGVSPKREAEDDTTDDRSRKRKKITDLVEVVDEGDGFVHIDDIVKQSISKSSQLKRNVIGEVSQNRSVAQSSLRRKSSQLSQKSIHISGDGSPMRIDVEPEQKDATPQNDFEGDTYVNSGNDDAPLQSPQMQGRFNSFTTFDAVGEAHVLSSNSKSVPLAPEADSQAFSHYAPQRVVEEALLLNQQQEIRDPFQSGEHLRHVQRKSAFMQKMSEIVQHSKAQQEQEQDRTLVNHQEMEDVSSGSSVEEYAEAEDEAFEGDPDEQEWEASIAGRHKTILDTLGHICRRLISHLIDSETAVDDIIDDYRKDGTFILSELENLHSKQSNETLRSIQKSNRKLSKGYGESLKKLKELHKQVSSTPWTEGAREWMENREKQYSQIRKLEALASGRAV